MAIKLQCKSCGKEKKTFSTFYRCSKHGVFCDNCVAKTGWGVFGSLVCPKCGAKVQSM